MTLTPGKILSAFLVPFFLIGCQSTGSAPEQVEESTPKESSQGIDLDKFHDDWSLKVLKVADNIDSFLGDERMENDSQKTRVRLRLDYLIREDEDNEFGVKLSAKISLPKLSNRWSLIIGGDDERDDFRRVDNTSDERTLALRFDKINNLTTNLSFDFGVRRPDDKYRVFGRVRHRKSFTHDKWVTRLDNKVYYYNSFGFEYDGIVDFDRVIPPRLMFRATTRLRWWEDEERCNDGWCPEQHFYLYQRFKKRNHILAYEFSTYFESDPSDGSDDYLEVGIINLRYRRKTPWDWLFWEVAPGIEFRRENDYNGNAGLLFRLEGIFGYIKDYGEVIDFGPERALDN